MNHYELNRENIEDFLLSHDINNKGITCFSKDNLNILMWSHYALNHTGVCLEFDARCDDDFFDTLYEVDYPDDIHFPHVVSLEENLKQYFFYTKSKDWKYEKEVRLVKQNEGLFPFQNTSLKAIYFGAKCNTKDTIIKLVTALYEGVKFYSVNLNTSNLTLSTNEIILDS